MEGVQARAHYRVHNRAFLSSHEKDIILHNSTTLLHITDILVTGTQGEVKSDTTAASVCSKY